MTLSIIYSGNVPERGGYPVRYPWGHSVMLWVFRRIDLRRESSRA
jgi:hypothetical protein